MKLHGAATILRWGLAFVFFYAAIAALISPDDWASFVPSFLANILPVNVFLAAFSVYELFLAGMLFIGKQLYWSSLLATVTLAMIVIFEFDFIDLVFRDVGLAFAALALFELARYNNDLNHEQ